MNNKCIESRNERKLKSLRKLLATSKTIPIDTVRIDVGWVADKLDDFIIFLNEDKKRFKNLEKAKYDFLEYLIKRSLKNERLQK